MVLLGLLGIATTAFAMRSVTEHHPLSARLTLEAARLLLAAPFGLIRARAVTVWRDTGCSPRRGSRPPSERASGTDAAPTIGLSCRP
ncbi:hypothetical protein ACWGCW_00105 [Streptomyces sp. NPDC054933]